MTFWAWPIFIAAAALEVAGDALIRKGIKRESAGHSSLLAAWH